MYIEEIQAMSNVLNFGEAVVGTYKTMILPLKNLGISTQTGTIYNSSSVFSLADNYSVDVSSTTNLTVKFEPNTNGGYTNIIKITGTDYDISGDIEVTLMGTGIPEPCCLLLFVCYTMLYRFRKL